MHRAKKELINLYMEHKIKQFRIVRNIAILAAIIILIVDKSILWIPSVPLILSVLWEIDLRTSVKEERFGKKFTEAAELKEFSKELEENKNN